MIRDSQPGPGELPAFVAPVIDPDSAPFWAGLRNRRLVAQRCARCQTLRWPLRSVCAACRARDWTEQTLSGRGTVYSWIGVHHPTVPTPPSLLPYWIALVAVEEEPRILIPAQYDGSAGDLRTGLPVTAAFHDTAPDVTVLHWRRAAAASGPEG